jgi:hypothetical protein
MQDYNEDVGFPANFGRSGIKLDLIELTTFITVDDENGNTGHNDSMLKNGVTETW